MKTIFRITVFSLTAVAIAYLIYRSADQLAAKQVDLSKIDYRWWAGAVTVYLISMLLSAFFWHRVLIAFAQQPKFIDSVAAFFTSQLGKYVPGKAMVVVIRTDMIRGDNVNTKPAAASVFVENANLAFHWRGNCECADDCQIPRTPRATNHCSGAHLDRWRFDLAFNLSKNRD